MNSYGIDCESIESLDQIDVNSNKIHYIWKNTDFMYNKVTNSEKLLILFHGAISERDGKLTNLPVFRGYNFNLTSTSILCLSDILLSKYRDRKLLLGWYLSTKKYNTFDVYKKIIKKVIEIDNAEKVIFHGSSGGGYPALLFSCIFDGYCFISNSQLYLDKYKYYSKFKEILDEDYKIHLDVQNIVEKYGPPKLLVLYCNTNDKTHLHEHNMPFSKFMKDKHPENIKVNFFIGIEPPENITHHHIQYPINENLRMVLEKYFFAD